MFDKYVYEGLHFLMKWSGKINSWAWRKQAAIVREHNRNKEMEELVYRQENQEYLEELKKKL